MLIGVGYVKMKSFMYDITSVVIIKFMGNWVDVFLVGCICIMFYKIGEIFNIVLLFF